MVCAKNRKRLFAGIGACLSFCLIPGLAPGDESKALTPSESDAFLQELFRIEEDLPYSPRSTEAKAAFARVAKSDSDAGAQAPISQTKSICIPMLATHLAELWKANEEPEDPARFWDTLAYMVYSYLNPPDLSRQEKATLDAQREMILSIIDGVFEEFCSESVLTKSQREMAIRKCTVFRRDFERFLTAPYYLLSLRPLADEEFSELLAELKKTARAVEGYCQRQWLLLPVDRPPRDTEVKRIAEALGVFLCGTFAQQIPPAHMGKVHVAYLRQRDQDPDLAIESVPGGKEYFPLGYYRGYGTIYTGKAVGIGISFHVYRNK